MIARPQPRPLLVAVALLIAGIATGRVVDADFCALWPPLETVMGLRWLAVTLLSLVAVAILLWRHGRMAVVALLAAVFVFGVFLIRYSDSRVGDGSAPPPVVEWLMDVMATQRERMADIFRSQGMPEDERAVVVAMTLGEQRGVDKALREAYSASGTAHVFSLSGLHLNILFAILAVFLPRRRMPHLSVAVLLVAVWMFVALVGFRAAVVRAAVMLSVYAVLSILPRRTDSLEALLFTCALLLVACPSWLFDVGFQMSFMAVFSIVMFFPPLYRLARLWPRDQGLTPADLTPPPVRLDRRTLCRASSAALWASWRWLWGVTAVSFVAQMGVTPLIIYYFGRVGCYFLLGNYVVMPCAFLILALAVVVLPLGLIAPYAPFLHLPLSLVCTVLTWVAGFQNAVMRWIMSLPGASIDGLHMTVAQTLLVYFVIFCAAALLPLSRIGRDR